MTIRGCMMNVSDKQIERSAKITVFRDMQEAAYNAMLKLMEEENMIDEIEETFRELR